jgi:copper chaperone CopZ
LCLHGEHFSYLYLMKYALILMALALSTASLAQKKAEIEFQVSGMCGMCETRIEKALDVPGVIMAEWDVETKKAAVVYKTKVLSEEQIHQLIANVGHDTSKIKATDEVYANLHGCCKYRELGGGSCTGENDQNHDDRHPE